MKFGPWVRLALISIAVASIVPIFAGWFMISRAGSHYIYCPNLPAGHLLPCMPSFEGIRLAALMTLVFSAPCFAMGSVILAATRRRK